MAAKLIDVLYLPLAWLLYFTLHSALASLSVKRWVAERQPRFAPYYRLVYNLSACLLLIPPLWLLSSARDKPLWIWQGVWGWAADGLAIAAIVGFWWSLRYYDIREFLGLRRLHAPQEQHRFSLSPFHRFVRHPWYFFALVIIWTRNMDPAWLVSSIAITLYFLIGSRLEEHKLANEFGDLYRRYRRCVPALIPLPGHYLSRTEKAALVAAAYRHTPSTTTH